MLFNVFTQPLDHRKLVNKYVCVYDDIRRACWEVILVNAIKISGLLFVVYAEERTRISTSRLASSAMCKSVSSCSNIAATQRKEVQKPRTEVISQNIRTDVRW